MSADWSVLTRKFGNRWLDTLDSCLVGIEWLEARWDAAVAMAVDTHWQMGMVDTHLTEGTAEPGLGGFGNHFAGKLGSLAVLDRSVGIAHR